MKNLIAPSILALFLSTFSIHAADLFDTREAVLAAASNKTTPSYLEPLMHDLSEKIKLFAEENDISTPRKRLAIWLVGTTILRQLNNAKVDAASNALINRGEFNRGNQSVLRGLQVLSKLVAETEKVCDFSDVKRLLWNAIWNFNGYGGLHYCGRADLNQDMPTQHGALRLCEWTALKHFYKNFDDLLATLYKVAFDNLPEEDADNPFNENGSWPDKKSALSDSLDIEGMMYLNPWLFPLESQRQIKSCQSNL